MSSLYPDVKPKKPDVQCILCGGYVIQDLWCEPRTTDLSQKRDPYAEKPCRDFTDKKEGEE